MSGLWWLLLVRKPLSLLIRSGLCILRLFPPHSNVWAYEELLRAEPNAGTYEPFHDAHPYTRFSIMDVDLWPG